MKLTCVFLMRQVCFLFWKIWPCWAGIAAHTYNSSTWEAKAETVPKVGVQPGLHSECQASQGYIARLYLKKLSTISFFVT